MSNLSVNESESFNNSNEILKDYFTSLKDNEMMSRDEEHRLLSEYINGGRVNKGIRERLFLANMRFVVSLAKKYASYGFPLIDLIQEGNIGMLESIDRYDFEKSNNGSLVNFASNRILLHIKRYTKKNLKMTSFGRTNDRDKLFFALPKYIGTDVVQMNDELANRIASELDVRACDVYDMFAYLRPYSHTSSDITNEEGEEISIYDTIPSEDAGADEKYVTEQYHNIINDALSILDKRLKIIIQRRHLIKDGDLPATLKAVGIELGVSGEAVRKMEIQAIKNMKRHILKNNGDKTSLFK